MVREAGHRAVQDAGDGTTAAIVLAAELYKEGFAALEAGKNAPSSMVWRGNRQITAL
jgi:chaperonin GroEL (HSP60 family)